MNGTGIRVTPEQLRQVAAQLNGAAGDIDGTLHQLAAGVEPLGTDWAGVAQAHFLDLWADWQRAAASLHQALTGIAQLTSQAATRYESTEHGIATSFAHR